MDLYKEIMVLFKFVEILAVYISKIFIFKMNLDDEKLIFIK